MRCEACPYSFANLKTRFEGCHRKSMVHLAVRFHFIRAQRTLWNNCFKTTAVFRQTLAQYEAKDLILTHQHLRVGRQFVDKVGSFANSKAAFWSLHISTEPKNAFNALSSALFATGFLRRLAERKRLMLGRILVCIVAR